MAFWVVFVRKGAFVLEQFFDVGFAWFCSSSRMTLFAKPLAKKFSAPVKDAGHRQVISLNSSEPLQVSSSRWRPILMKPGNRHNLY